MPQPHPSEVALAVEDLSVRYGGPASGRLVCQGISFELAAHEKITVLGPTGCGKSTMLKALAGYLPLAAGRVEVRGRTISGPGQERFVMFQAFDQLFPWQTIRSNVMYALRARARKDGRRTSRSAMGWRADELLAMVGLGGRGDLYPAACSGGMKQRVALARALAVEPVVLLLDEPFGALDAQTRQRLQEQLLEVCAVTGVAILFVTHDISEAIMIGDRVMMMGAEGTASALFAAGSVDGDRLPAEDERSLAATLRELLHTAPAPPAAPADQLARSDRLGTPSVGDRPHAERNRP